MLRGLAQAGGDVLVVIGDIVLVPGQPGELVCVDGLAVDHCADLVVAGAEVETYPTAIQVASQRDGGFVLVWHPTGGYPF